MIMFAILQSFLHLGLITSTLEIEMEKLRCTASALRKDIVSGLRRARKALLSGRFFVCVKVFCGDAF